MKLIYLGAEIPHNRTMLREAGVTEVGLSYFQLRKLLPKKKKFVLEDRYEGFSVHATVGAQPDLTNDDLAELHAGYKVFVEENAGFLSSWEEPEQGDLRLVQREREYWATYDPALLRPIWTPNQGAGALEDVVRAYPVVGIPFVHAEDPRVLADLRRLHNSVQAKYRLLGCARPDEIPALAVAEASTLAWTAPMRRGETIVFANGKLHRYPAKMKAEARARHRALIERIGLDWDRVAADIPDELTRLALWSLREWEAAQQVRASITVLEGGKRSDNSDHPAGSAIAEPAPGGGGNSGIEVRNPLKAREQVVLPVLGLEVATVVTDEGGQQVVKEVATVTSSTATLRQCDTCVVAAACPAAKPNSQCAFSLPVEVRTREQLRSLMGALVEMQGMRVAFGRYVEEVNGGYPDANVSLEMDRFFRMVKAMKDIEDNREIYRMTVERQTSGGVLSAIFGDKAQRLTELPGPVDETKLIPE